MKDIYNFLEKGSFTILRYDPNAKETYTHEVFILQTLLIEYFGIPFNNKDGYYGTLTQELVIAFQIKENIKPVDGVASKQTWGKLRSFFLEKRNSNSIFLPQSFVYSTSNIDKKSQIADEINESRNVPYEKLLCLPNTENLLDKITNYIPKDCISSYILGYTLLQMLDKENSNLSYGLYAAFLFTIPLNIKIVSEKRLIDFLISLFSFVGWSLIIGTPFDDTLDNPKLCGFLSITLLTYVVPLIVKKYKKID